MTRGQALILIGAIALFGFLIFIFLFSALTAAEEVSELNDDIEIVDTEVPDTPTPTAYLSPTPGGAVATVVTPIFDSGAGGGQAFTGGQPDNSVQVVQAATAVNCTPASDLPVYIVQDGDILSAIAEGVGATVEELIAYNCLLDEDELLVGQTLYVPVAPDVQPTTARIVVTSTPADPDVIVVSATPDAEVIVIVEDAGAGGAGLACEFAWFFTFNADQTDLLNACPEPPTVVQAVGQNFENGRVYLYDAPPLTSDTRGIAFVVYNDGTWEAYLDTWDESLPVEDPALVPPANLIQPTGAIGKIWRENPTVQDNLGWAVELPIPFTGRTQLPTVASAYFYIDHGLDGLVLRLISSADVTNTWELVGLYG